MADEPIQGGDAPAISDVAAAIVAEQLSPENLEKLRKHAQTVNLEQQKDTNELGWSTVNAAATLAARLILGAINAPEPLYNALASTAVDTLLGEGQRHAAAPADVGVKLLNRLAGGDGEVTPGVDGAANYLTLMVNESVEAWTRGVLVELISEFMPKLGGVGGGIETFAGLEEIIEGALGGGRMMRRVLQPFITATAIRPAEWHVNKKYRPELLNVATAIRALIRGDYTDDEMREELRRQGLSEKRIGILVRDTLRGLSSSESIEAWQLGINDELQVRLDSKFEGTDETVALLRMRIDTAKRHAQIYRRVADAAAAAFEDGRISAAEMRAAVQASVPNLDEQTWIVDAAEARAGLQRRYLSSAEERRLALGGIRSVVDFRRALERENYAPEAIDALDLELRADLSDQRDIEKAKADQAAQRDADKAKATADKEAREADLAARKALPTLQEYRRAYVRGFIDRESFVGALTREKVAITPADLDVLLLDADADRGAFLADQEKRAAAAARPAASTISASQLEGFVLEGVITLSEFDARLAQAAVPDADRRLLVAGLSARLEDAEIATAKRNEAAKRAVLAGVSLSDFERAVRMGVRTVDQYAAWLDTIGTTDVAKALIIDLLRAQLGADAQARATRDARDAAAAGPGLTLAQRRRAYVAGVRPRAYYADALVAAGWSVDDQLAELQLADLEADAAAAARVRRDQVEAETEQRRLEAEAAAAAAAAAAAEPPPAPTLTLAQMEKAVSLQLATPNELRAWLSTRGYGADDVELIVNLVLAGIPDVRAGQQREQVITGELAAKFISIADWKTSVKRGLRTIEQYSAMLAGAGYGADDVDLLTQLLREEVALGVDGLRTKVAARLAKTDGAPPLEDVMASFDAGELDVPGLRDVLIMFGVDRDTAIVFARLLATYGLEG